MIKYAWMGVAVLLCAVPASSQDASSSPTPAVAPSKTEESQLSRLLTERRDPQGRRCELRAMVSSGSLRFLACGDAGVWTVRLAPGRSAAELIDQRAIPGVAAGFFLRDGTVWVEMTTVSAERLAPVAPDATVQNHLLPTPSAIGGDAVSSSPLAAATPVPTAPPPAATPAPTTAPLSAAQPPAAAPEPPPLSGQAVYHQVAPVGARVVKLEPGFAIIDMGSEHGVASGDHVSFERITRERIDGDEGAVQSVRVAVGNATTIATERSRVQLGIDERVEVGSIARPTRDPVSSSSFAPPRIGGVWHAGFLARPFLVIDNFGVGAAFEGRAGYRWDAPIHVEALVLPLAIGSGRENAIGAFAGIVTASFDSRLFEAGLGVGGQTMNDPSFDLQPGSGTTFAQRLRIGSADGGMLELFTYIVLFHRNFEFSDLQAHGQLPVGDRSWIVVNAGGGSLGMGFGELGLRVLLTGNGDRGSFFLTATIGGIRLFRSRFCTTDQFNCSATDYVGPHVGLGADWRF